MREAARDHEHAEALAQLAADAGDSNALVELARRREQDGNPEQAEVLARQAAEAGGGNVLVELTQRREAT
ncbi:hypothetical protein [Streptomyces scabiei]|uniref:hypothetical protein n=1 Tax=Streptomyces scabiei TaxID=1930 RepID=UPI0029B20666|nr:hypothetical protein [Streptomyces scabiei]MDX3523603.1 hypothetical protein [Streptomyces scabiei]